MFGLGRDSIILAFMGRAKRKYSNFLVQYKKSFRQPLLKVGSIMPSGFNDDLFYKEFKILFPNFWDDICTKYTEYKRMDEGLVKKGLKKRYFFPSPNTFLKTVSSKTISIIRINHKQNTGGSVEAERIEFRSELLRQAQNKIAKRAEIRDSNLKDVQELEPQYSNYFIDEYFNIKHNKPEDVSTRFIILLGYTN